MPSRLGHQAVAVCNVAEILTDLACQWWNRPALLALTAGGERGLACALPHPFSSGRDVQQRPNRGEDLWVSLGRTSQVIIWGGGASTQELEIFFFNWKDEQRNLSS